MSCKSLDRENEVKVKWHLPDWHLHLPMFLHAKYCWPITNCYWETDLIMKMWHKSQDREKLYRHNFKMRSRSSDTCTTDIYTFQCWPISCSYWETVLITKMWRKSQNCEYEVKVKWHFPDWHVHLPMYLDFCIHILVCLGQNLTPTPFQYGQFYRHLWHLVPILGPSDTFSAVQTKIWS